MITFQEAVEQTKALYCEAKRLYGDDLNDAFQENRIEFWAMTHQYDLDLTIESLDEDLFTFETVKRAIALRLKKNLPLSKITRDWLIKLISGEIEKPKKIAGRRNAFGRNSFIIYAIQRLKSQGMIVNPRLTSAMPSACEVIAEVVKAEDLSLRRITNIWNERPKSYSFGQISWHVELNIFSQTLMEREISQK